MEWTCIWDKVHCHEDVKLIWGIISRTDSWDTEKTSRGENRNGHEDEHSIKLAQHGVRQVARWLVIFKLGVCYHRVSYIHWQSELNNNKHNHYKELSFRSTEVCSSCSWG